MAPPALPALNSSSKEKGGFFDRIHQRLMLRQASSLANVEDMVSLIQIVSHRRIKVPSA
jgi:hypothetical protein